MLEEEDQELQKQILEHRRAEEALRRAYDELKRQVEERTTELLKANKALKEQIAERRQVEGELRQQNEYLTALHETTLDLMNRLELDDLLEAIVKRAGALVGTQHGYVFLVETGETVLEMKVGVGVYSKLIGQRIKPGEGFNGRIWQTGQSLVVEDYSVWPGRMPDPEFDILRAVVGVPLKIGSRVVGVLGLVHLEEGRIFGEDELLLLSRLAELASIALDNVRLYTAAQQELAERKQVEIALRESERNLRLIGENASDVIFAYDMSRRLLYVNSAFETLTGYTVAELRERQFINYLHPEDETRMMALFEGLFQGKSFKDVEFRIITWSGEVKWCMSNWGPLLDDHGIRIGIQGREYDITERKCTEEKLHRQNEYLTALHETSLGLMNRLELDDLLKAIIERAIALVGTSHGHIHLVEPEKGEIVVRVGMGMLSNFIGLRQKLGEGAAGKVWQTGQPLTINNYHTWPGRLP
ncbi:MAG: GAF domain-containing protein, partial [Nitrososphaera sp.]|nr:GAF domain-containing protein [Nitrososphaera sp.]